jgi:hypothetical protein
MVRVSMAMPASSKASHERAEAAMAAAETDYMAGTVRAVITCPRTAATLPLRSVASSKNSARTATPSGSAGQCR